MVKFQVSMRVNIKSRECVKEITYHKNDDSTVQLYIGDLRSNRGKGAGKLSPTDGGGEGPSCCCKHYLYLSPYRI
jgi:hypothetical protein